METQKDKNKKTVPPAMTRYVFLQAHDLLTQVASVDESDLRPIIQEIKIEEKEKKEGDK